MPVAAVARVVASADVRLASRMPTRSRSHAGCRADGSPPRPRAGRPTRSPCSPAQRPTPATTQPDQSVASSRPPSPAPGPAARAWQDSRPAAAARRAPRRTSSAAGPPRVLGAGQRRPWHILNFLPEPQGHGAFFGVLASWSSVRSRRGCRGTLVALVDPAGLAGGGVVQVVGAGTADADTGHGHLAGTARRPDPNPAPTVARSVVLARRTASASLRSAVAATRTGHRTEHLRDVHRLDGGRSLLDRLVDRHLDVEEEPDRLLLDGRPSSRRTGRSPRAGTRPAGRAGPSRAGRCPPAGSPSRRGARATCGRAPRARRGARARA